MVWKSFYFDGESSAEHGLFITGEAVYNAPRYDYEFVEIQGRNGDLILDNGRFENIRVTYPCSLRDVSKLAEVRTWLYSKRGYLRLSDDYNTNEYRLGCVSEALDINPFHDSAADFTVTFNCKPQRFLVSGDEEYGNVIPAEVSDDWTGYRTPLFYTPSASNIVRIKPSGNVSAITNAACNVVSIWQGPTLPSDAATQWRSGNYVTIPSNAGGVYYMRLDTAYEWTIETDLLTGELETFTMKSAETVANDTAYESAPVFIMRGANENYSLTSTYAAQFTVNGVRVRVARDYLVDHAGKDLYIDSEIQDCYYIDDDGNAQNANSYVSLVNEETGELTTDFPKFAAGSNVIEWQYETERYFVPLTAITYKPRYYTI